jgi:hypothetical protein
VRHIPPTLSFKQKCKNSHIMTDMNQTKMYYLRFQILTTARVKFRVFWDVAPCSHVEVHRRFREDLIVLMTEALRTSETSVSFNVTTRRYIPKDSKRQEFIMFDTHVTQRSCINWYVYIYIRSARKSRKEKVRNITIREVMEVRKNILKVIEEKRLRWFGHVKSMPGNRLPLKVLE